MEIKEMVTIYNNEPRAGTYSIAKGLERNHKNLIRTVDDNRKDFEDFGVFKTLKSKSTGGRPTQEYLLNEQQTTLLITYLRNLKKNDKVRQFKKALVKEFYRMKNVIIRAKAQHKDTEWIEARQAGKLARLQATDTIKDFEIYATAQGSENANMYYINITQIMNSLLFIVDGTFKNLRELMTPLQLMTVSSAEQIIDKALRDGMRKKMFYKEIYKLVKERVQLFADLHGQSEIISKQLLLFELNLPKPKVKDLSNN